MIARLEGWFGRRGLLIVGAAPVLAAITVGGLMPSLTHSDVEASALIDMYPIVGTHSAYDVAAYVVDFSASYSAADAARAPSDTPEVSATSVAPGHMANREGDSARVRVTIAASSQDAAEAGLRAATRVALHHTATGIRDRSQENYDLARRAFVSLMTDVEAWTPQKNPDAAPGSSVEASRIRSVQQSGQRMQIAREELAAADLSVVAVDGIVDSAVVTSSRLSSRGAQTRVVMTAALSSLVAAVVAVLLVRRRSVREKWAKRFRG